LVYAQLFSSALDSYTTIHGSKFEREMSNYGDKTLDAKIGNNTHFALLKITLRSLYQQYMTNAPLIKRNLLNGRLLNVNLFD
jgi:hypothetical protein